MFASVKTLLSAIVDYAGLFPPAKLDLPQAIAHYQRYRQSPEAWMLGQFVLPLSQLPELVSLLPPEAESNPWSLSVILSNDFDDAIAQVNAFTHPGLTIQSLEIAPLPPEAIKATATQLPAHLDCFFEIPINESLPVYLDILQSLRVLAKIRTGGIMEAAFPSVAQLAQCLLAFAKAQVPFKATAGLHHPLPGCHPLTYDPDSPSTSMQGFLNLTIAAALAYTQRVTLEEVLQLLQENCISGISQAEKAAHQPGKHSGKHYKHPSGFQMQMNGIAWGDHYLTLEELAASRNHGFRSFGSCSFTEPIADLKALKLLN
jgi:hypothetical protein